MVERNHHLKYNVAYRYGKFKHQFDLLSIVEKIKFLLFLFVVVLTLIACIIITINRF